MINYIRGLILSRTLILAYVKFSSFFLVIHGVHQHSILKIWQQIMAIEVLTVSRNITSQMGALKL